MIQHTPKATWLNNRDQFLFPNDGWKTDTEFQNDCLAFTLFHGQNRISSRTPKTLKSLDSLANPQSSSDSDSLANPQSSTNFDPLKGVMGDYKTNIAPSKGLAAEQTGVLINHWIPSFTENQVNAPERFESHFMTDFMSGKLGGTAVEECLPFQNKNKNGDQEIASTPNTKELFASTQENFVPTKPLEFSPEAQAVFEAGRELWKYYFQSTKNLPLSRGQTEGLGVSNPSLYDIKVYFQGVDEKGRMNNKSDDEKYNQLMANLRQSLEALGAKIQPKVYKYGFLK